MDPKPFKKIEFKKKSELAPEVFSDSNEKVAQEILPGFQIRNPSEVEKMIAEKIKKGEISEIPFSEN